MIHMQQANMCLYIKGEKGDEQDEFFNFKAFLAVGRYE
jgi:hypothetical protein